MYCNLFVSQKTVALFPPAFRILRKQEKNSPRTTEFFMLIFERLLKLLHLCQRNLALLSSNGGFSSGINLVRRFRGLLQASSAFISMNSSFYFLIFLKRMLVYGNKLLQGQPKKKPRNFAFFGENFQKFKKITYKRFQGFSKRAVDFSHENSHLQ